MHLIIPGNPIPKARHRHALRKGKVITYDSQEKMKKYFKLAILSSFNEILHSENRQEASLIAQGSVFHVDLIFHIPVPVSMSQKAKKCVLWHFDLPCKKPDLDNLIKFILDAMNEIIFNDDKSIISLTAKKIYSYDPKTEIYIKEIVPMIPSEKQKEIAMIFDPQKLNKFLVECEILKRAHELHFIDQIIDSLQSIAKKYSSDFTKIKKLVS